MMRCRWSLLVLCAFVLALLACPLCRADSNEELDEDDDDAFTCDESKVLPEQRINDDFCDCLDGSDEPLTSACPNGRFKCINKGFLSTQIPSSHVNDTLCDCCDGSDERPGRCPNSCPQAAEQYLQDMRQRLAVQTKALSQRQAMIRSAKQLMRKQRRAMAPIQNRIRQMEATLEDARKRRVPQGSEEYFALSSMFQEMHKLKRQVGIQLQLLDSADADDDDDDDDDEAGAAGKGSALLGDSFEFYPLSLKCFALPWSKRRYGHFGLEEDKYVMELCPYMNATQYEEKAYSATHPTSATPVADTSTDDDPKAWSLGVFRKWTLMDTAGQGGLYGIMHYEGGEQCWKGPRRSVAVNILCGSENALTEVRENGLCTYEFDFETPAACDEGFVVNERRKLKGYEKRFVVPTSSSGLKEDL